MRPGEIVDNRFEIEVLAGAGGMGSVYRARDLDRGGKVALKLLNSDHRSMVQRFIREAMILSELQHPSIVQYVAHGVHRDALYLAMEWLDGEDLDQTLAATGKLSIRGTLELAQHVGSALAVAHARGIIHRDLKPSNLFLVQAQVERVKVLDFGIARGSNAMYRVTKTGAVCGTPGYMAPEQARGKEDVSEAADVFSLGCVLFECLTGQPAFPGQHVMAILAKILMEPTPRVRQLRPEVSPALEDLIARMLAKSPSERPPNAAKLLAELAVLIPAERFEPQRAASAPTTLTGREQGLLSVLLIQTRTNPPDPVVLTAAGRNSAVPNADGAAHALAAEHSASQDLFSSGRPRLGKLPEGVRTIFAEAERYDGKLEILRDGNFVVLFEPETAATDLASQAARCALSLKKLRPEACMALATGRGMMKSNLPIGEVIDRAAALLGSLPTLAADADAELPPPSAPHIAIDSVTAGLLDSEFEIALNGSGERYLVSIGEKTDTSRLLMGKPTPFVGRDQELSTLEALFVRCAEESTASAALITGPAGAGKSRLRYELTRRLRSRSEKASLWQARGDPTRAGSPFGLLAQALRSVFGVVDGEGPEVSQQKLLQAVGERIDPSNRRRVAEFLGELIGVHFPDEDSVQLRAARRDPRIMGDQMTRAWEDWLGAACAHAPVVLILEDLHWGDLPTIKLVDSVLRNLADSPFLVVGLGRPEMFRTFPDLWKERALANISLPALSKRACEQLVYAVLDESVPKHVVARVIERAAGNAFFLEELIRAQVEGSSEDTPQTVLAMVQARLSRLSAEARQVLRAGSVFGQVFWEAGIHALLGPSELTRPELDALVEGEWLKTRRDSRLAGEVEYGFRHALMREAVYATLTDEDCRLGHRLAAEWLERAGEHDAIALAEHFKRGADLARAAGCYHRAAEQALEGDDLTAALSHAERAINCAGPTASLGKLRLIQAEAHNWRGEYERAVQRGREAMQHLELSETSDSSGGRWAHAVHQVVWASAALGRLDEVERLAQMLLQKAQTGASELLVIALAATASQLISNGVTGPVPQILQWLRTNADPIAERDPIAAGCLKAVSAFDAVTRLNLVESLHLHEAAAQAFERAGHQRWLGIELTNAASMRSSMGDYERAHSGVLAALALAARLDLRMPIANYTLGLILAATDRLEAARETLESVLKGTRLDQRADGGVKTLLSRVLVLSGDPASAEIHARAATEITKTLPSIQAYALAGLANALLAQNHVTEACEAARQALEIADSIGSLEDGEAFIRLVHAESLRAAGDEAGAQRAVHVAHERLRICADRIEDLELRSSFLTRIPEHARILELAKTSELRPHH